MEANYDYFDEAYFQDGAQRGTVYNNYLSVARTSPIYKEIASAVYEVFQPKRVLEIGCATGIMVKYLNDLGAEAHGIDVSAWATEHGEHPNVKQASADQLAYPDGYFDLVFSCHSLEHLPDDVVDGTFAEIDRVSSGLQFHMLPLVGTHPHTGPITEVIESLRKDPTHFQLHPMTWWLDRFQKKGFAQIPAQLLFRHDNEQNELSHGQFLCTRESQSADPGIVARANQWNLKVLDALRSDAAKLVGTMGLADPELVRESEKKLRYDAKEWQDVHHEINRGPGEDITNDPILLVTQLKGQPCELRLAVSDDRGSEAFSNCAERWVALQPGYNWFLLTSNDFRTLRGEPDFRRINRLAFGGQAEDAEVSVWLLDRGGRSLLSA